MTKRTSVFFSLSILLINSKFHSANNYSVKLLCAKCFQLTVNIDAGRYRMNKIKTILEWIINKRSFLVRSFFLYITLSVSLFLSTTFVNYLHKQIIFPIEKCSFFFGTIQSRFYINIISICICICII